MILAKVMRRRLSAHLLSWFGLGLAIIGGFNGLSQINQLQNDYQMSAMIQYVLMILPYHLGRYDGLLLGLALLSFMHSVLKNQTGLLLSIHGQKARQLLWWIMPVVAVAVIIMLFLTELLAPRLADYAQHWRTEKMYVGHVVNAQKQLWIKTNDGILSADIGSTPDQLLNVVRYHYNQSGQLISWDTAKEAWYEQQQWQTNGLQTAQLTKNQEGLGPEISYRSEGKQAVAIPIKPVWLSALKVQSPYLSIAQAWHIAMNAPSTGVANSGNGIMLWLRVLQPLHWLCITCVIILRYYAAVSLRHKSQWLLNSGVLICLCLDFCYREWAQSWLIIWPIYQQLCAATLPSLLVLGIWALPERYTQYQ